MFKKDDLIFLAVADTSPSIEHIIKVKEYDEVNNIVTTNKCVTFIKELRTGSMQSFANLGIFSSMPQIENGNYGDTKVNLNCFPFYGLVSDKLMLENFDAACSKLMVASSEQTKKIIL